MKHIASSENTMIKKAMKLKQRKMREKEGLYFIEGLSLCREALAAAVNIDMLMIRESEYYSKKNGEYGDLLEQSSKAGIETVVVKDGLFNKLTDAETPQGITVPWLNADTGMQTVSLPRINQEGTYLCWIAFRIRAMRERCFGLLEACRLSGCLGG